MQKWFSVGSGGDDDGNRPQQATSSSSSSSSLLADWNSYTASKASDESGGGIFDLEAAVRSANDTVSGTFSVVSKGVRDLPGNLQSATSSLPSGKSLMYFGMLLATGVFFIFIAFTLFLPVIVLVPQKFALCFTFGCGLIIGSFFALKGPKNQFLHMFSKERLPFTLGFLGTMVGTVYVSMGLHSYILSVIFSVLQVLALAYYAVSYFPGGSAGMKFMLSANQHQHYSKTFNQLFKYSKKYQLDANRPRPRPRLYATCLALPLFCCCPQLWILFINLTFCY